MLHTEKNVEMGMLVTVTLLLGTCSVTVNGEACSTYLLYFRSFESNVNPLTGTASNLLHDRLQQKKVFSCGN